MRNRDSFQLIGTVVDERYRVEQVVGEGGFGVVYRAHHLALDGPVALKVLKMPDDDAIRRAMTDAFKNEGKVLFSLGAMHPSIVRVTESGTLRVAGGATAPYLVLEWLDGVTLDQELRHRRAQGLAPLSLADAVVLLDGPAAALAAAHRHGIAHRDIKPGNLFLSMQDGQPVPKLLDFGTAKVLEASCGRTTLLADTLGAPCWFTHAFGAPEQWDRELGATGPWTDVYALALTCMAVLLQESVYQGETETLRAACLDGPNHPTPRRRGLDVSDAVEHAFARALALEPRDRFPDAGEFWAALTDGLDLADHDFPTIATLADHGLAGGASPSGSDGALAPGRREQETLDLKRPRPRAPSTSRFELERRLGAGAFGEVFQALDTLTHARVALKTLQRADASSLHRFKQEFRSLADISHPNLVQLYELFFEEERWFYTMELVPGSSLLEHLSSVPIPAQERNPGISPTYVRALEEAIAQLVKGTQALHNAGKLHRDLKPSNVIVTPLGRVVLLDFGLVTDVDDKSLGNQTLDAVFMGTPYYMSPEQMAGGPITAASDWYSVGVMLYQALCGHLPILGENLYELLGRKQTKHPRPLRERVPGVPPHLDALCMELLSIRPDRRPTGQDILRRLDVAQRPPSPSQGDVCQEQPSNPLFVGRAPQLAALEEAFRASTRGSAVPLWVSGPSGMGKTALVQQFLRGLASREPVVLLTGRCYQQESMPFNAWDGIIDSLGRYLRRLPAVEAAALLPRHARDLVRLFPVLERVEVLANASKKGLLVHDPAEVKQRAFAAIKGLLVRISDLSPLVLFLDDLQWGDLDSALLLREVLSGPDRPCMLVIGCYRSEEEDASPMLRELFQRGLEEELGARTLTVSALSEERSLELAQSLLREHGRDEAQAGIIARESEGIPFFIKELAQFSGERADPPLKRAPSAVGLNKLVRLRASTLPEDAQRLLELIAVAARPVPVSICLKAAGAQAGSLKSLALLRSKHLVRAESVSADQSLTTYHDRIRECVVDNIPPETVRQYHLELAEAFEASEAPDPERLSVHYHQAGVPQKAAVYTIQAAERAFASFAYDQAARLYRLAVELRARAGARDRDLLVRLAEALANAGRGRDAAEVYLQAARGQAPEAVIHLRHRASFQLLSAGYRKEGLSIVREVLESVGLRLPRYNWWGILRMLLRRAWLRLRGLGFRERSVTEIDPALLLKSEACYAVAISMSVADPMFGWVDFQTRQLLLALAAGEPSRVQLALSSEGMILGISGNEKRAIEVADQCLALAEQLDDPVARGRAILQQGSVGFWAGRWRAAFEKFEQATELLCQDRTRIDGYRIAAAKAHALWSLTNLGHLREVSRRLPALLREAREQHNRSHEFLFGQDRTHAWILLAGDDPDEARREIQLIFERLIRDAEMPNRWYPHHALGCHVSVELYAGNAQAAWDEVTRRWPTIVRSLVHRIAVMRGFACRWRGQAAVALAAEREGAERATLLTVARQCCRAIDRSPVACVRPASPLLRAGIATVEGTPDRALALLRDAEQAYADVDMDLDVQVCRRRRGALTGGDEGRALVAAADARMAEETVVVPGRWSDMVAPGVWPG